MALLIRILVASAILSTLGCAASPLPTLEELIGARPYSEAVWTTDDMYLVARGPGALFIAPSPTDLNAYRGFMLDEIEISTKEGSDTLTPDHEEWLKGSLRRGLLRLFDQEDWATQPGADVLRVRLAIRDLELHRVTSNVGGSVIANREREITIILELRDSIGRNRVLVYGQSGELPFGAYSGLGQVEINRVRDAFRDFIRDARRHLVAARRGLYPPPPKI